ncbi:MAG: VWA domain-containing protein [Terriglobia bacterium]|jgi:VWFA-related protein
MYRRRLIPTYGFLIALSWLSLAPVTAPAASGKEKNPSAQAESTAPGVIKSEANMVLVDVVVTDKKGHYLNDMNQKEFHVFEDGVERPITSFSREADITPGAPERQRYMVLFFDNAGLDPEGQMWERDAATKFVEGTASPNRLMAVLDYGGGLHVAQNFTADRDLLMSAVRKVKFASAQTNPSGTSMGSTGSRLGMRGGATGAEQKQADLALRNLLLAIRDVAKMLGTAPGRKTILFLSAGFNLTSERQFDFQDTLDALNKANVGVYPVDPTGLTSMVGGGGRRMGSSTFSNPVLYALAAKTGGFPVVNTNDLAGGMEKVSAEMNEYYLLGYVPPHPGHEGAYHKIHVKVDRAGTEVRARNGYSETKSPDLLAGKTEGVALEAKVASFEAGEIPVTLSAPYFYVRPGIARINLALSIPGSAIDFEKHRDNFQSQINVLGIAYREDGSVAARFSDTVDLDYEKDEKKEVTKTPFDYQHSFKIAPGEYTFKLVLSAGGGKFGKYIVPLIVDPFSGKQFTLSGPAFGDRFVPSPLSSADIDQTLIEGSAPMVANGMQVVPSSNNHFKKDMQPVVYVEVYDPILRSSSPQMGILYNIVNRRTKQKVYSSNTLPINQYVHQGSPLVPVIFSLPMDKLPVGDYRMEIWGRDSAENVSPVLTGDFSIE